MGRTYKFRVQSRNSYGYSVSSDFVAILCATNPAIPIAPTSTVINDQVLIDWIAPSDQGTPIIGYNILLKQADGEYTAELANCDGSDQTIVTLTECTIPLSTLYAAPFNLKLGDLIAAKVSAYNLYGESPESEIGGGALI